jgi:YD repeat-containing protein
MLAQASISDAQGDPAAVLNAPGFQQNHDYFSALPFENIDTATGGLVLTFTDLVLPGNAGRDLRFQRTYNSKVGYWTFGIAGVPLQVGDSWWGNMDGQNRGVSFLTVDGGVQRAAMPLTSVPGNLRASLRVMMTDRFWKYDRETRRLSMPDGSVYHYNAKGQLVSIVDVFTNIVLLVEWQPNQVIVRQYLSTFEAGPSRTVTLTLPNQEVCSLGGPGCVPTTMSFEGRTWKYDGTPLQAVKSPEGDLWQYAYGNPMTITTPHGGQIKYGYEIKSFPTGLATGDMIHTNVTNSREVIDVRGQASGIWRYDYDMTAVSAELSTVTTITGPLGPGEVTLPETTIETFRHGWWGNGATSNNGALIEYMGRTYVLTERTLTHAGVELESETRAYKYVPLASANAFDAVPELTERVITRGGKTYKTEWSYSTGNYGDYHQPYEIVETGEGGETSRTTTRQFWYPANGLSSMPCILAQPTRERVTANGGGQFETAWAYDPATGFRTAETVGFRTGEDFFGLMTTFAPDAYGNLASVTRPSQSVTSFEYSFGQVSKITTARHVTNREINTDGTIQSETRAGRTTSYEYDGNARLKKTILPGGTNHIVTTYAADGSTVTTTRGPSEVKTTVDGFGRPIRTENSRGVTTITAYDPLGRKKHAGIPFIPLITDDKRVEIKYDGLGRVIEEVNPGGTIRTRSYAGNTVTATDENGRQTVLTHHAFGDPDDTRLVKLVDAKNQEWNYTYDTPGNLRAMTGNGVTRTWVYNAQNLLDSETHLESGTVTSVYTGGLLTQQTDANGTVTTYAYDDNDRLERITAGTHVTAITYEAGSDNRASTTVDGNVSQFVYDGGGRLATRTDTIDGKVFVTRHKYDQRDNLAEVEYPGGRKVHYLYDSESRLTRVFNAVTGHSYARISSYHQSGQPAAFTMGNGITTKLTYDVNRHWIIGIASGPLQLTYENYDNVGNVRTITGGDATQTFTYDELDRLKTVSGPTSATYAYDAHGNRTGDGLGYDSNNPFRLTSITGLAMTYDASGNLKTAPQAEYWYTPANLMEKATVGGTTTRFAYDADAWRLKKAVDNGTPQYFLRGAAGQLLTEWTNSSPDASVRDYIYAGSRLIAVVPSTQPAR